jgi:hypothetical protein
VGTAILTHLRNIPQGIEAGWQKPLFRGVRRGRAGKELAAAKDVLRRRNAADTRSPRSRIERSQLRGAALPDSEVLDDVCHTNVHVALPLRFHEQDQR